MKKIVALKNDVDTITDILFVTHSKMIKLNNYESSDVDKFNKWLDECIETIGESSTMLRYFVKIILVGCETAAKSVSRHSNFNDIRDTVRMVYYMCNYARSILSGIESYVEDETLSGIELKQEIDIFCIENFKDNARNSIVGNSTEDVENSQPIKIL